MVSPEFRGDRGAAAVSKPDRPPPRPAPHRYPVHRMVRGVQDDERGARDRGVLHARAICRHATPRPRPAGQIPVYLLFTRVYLLFALVYLLFTQVYLLFALVYSLFTLVYIRIVGARDGGMLNASAIRCHPPPRPGAAGQHLPSDELLA